ncbi:MBL fold metallo-hydrolase [Mycolicibacterium neworleansense]|uniref:Beta-lactamase domain-containing protein n=1 Tax=Mycolicibacterium neworleansense TaxID=146018 RepID=A0A0H5S3I8_9MYCO|nr:MBL fold metallo-hydrolase [Mycolicibacterium neworleansense]MCV7364890.1 MBL fold metallo-hydrolase [Mycolicibacterium neworleansense]CRZ15684.1 beta-lactamase domain-containing protein [Mycolicibacterium neworleansense]
MAFSDEHLIPLVDGGLGNSSYLVNLGDGRALAVDASRDLRALRQAATRRGLTIAFAADTHLHADFLSGAVQLHHDTGAQIVASAAGHRSFDHIGVRDGDEIDLGGLRLRAWATPGHTDEHVAFLLLDGDREVGMFTGGSLIVGSAARTDLLGPDRVEELTRAQYRSLQRLATLSDDVAVWPTHGAGSFCSAPPGAERISTIGEQKRSNSLLTANDEDRFVADLLTSLGSYPDYFRRLTEHNRRGPSIMPGAPALKNLGINQFDAVLDAGAVVVDVRSPAAFAAGHIPGALSVSLRDQFATWLGWLVDDDKPVVFVTEAGQDPAEIGWQAYKIGYERLAGILASGMDTWRADGRPQRELTFAAADKLLDRPFLDVRQDAEFRSGHVGGAVHIELGVLRHRFSDVPDGAVVACGHGERAMTAASLLRRYGRDDLAVLNGGPGDYSAADGRELVSGREHPAR